MKKVSFVIISFLLAILILVILIKTSPKEHKIQLIQDRVINEKLIENKSISLDRVLGLMKLSNNQITLACWGPVDRNALFTLDDQYNIKKWIDIDISKDSIVVDNYFFSNGNVYIINSLDGSIMNLDSNGFVKEKYSYPKAFFRIENRNDLFLISGWDSKYNLFHEKFKFETKEAHKVLFNDSYLNEYKINGIALDGNYYSNDKITVNLPYAVNRLYLFNDVFEYEGSMNLNYNKLPYNYRSGRDGEIVPDPNNLLPNTNAFLDSNNLFYILTNQATKWNKENQFFIDIYDLNKKKYVESIKIDDYKGETPREFVLHDNKVYVLFKSHLVIYSRTSK